MARIVLIDDEPELREVLAELLRESGHEALVASDGKTGLAAVRAERPDLVLCDINMPEMDGFAVLRAIRADPATAPTPFIFLTSETEVRAGMLSGADDYLVKPVGAPELLAAIDARLARQSEARREAERRVDEMRRRVAAALPHELRTPLTTILGSARLLQELHRDLAPAEIEALAGGIVTAAERLHRMAENYILFADLEVRRLTGAGEDGSVSGSAGAEEVRAAALEAGARRSRGGDVTLDLGAVTLPVAPSFARKLVWELTDNALKFSVPGTPVTVSLRDRGGAVLQVADRGHGMSADQVRQVGAFQQFDRARFEQQGSGVGLAVARAIAQASGGRLDLVSRKGEGTTVAVQWPG